VEENLSGTSLAVATKALVASGSISPLDALPLIGFRAEWAENELIAAALPLCCSVEAKSAVLQFAYRYMTLETQTAQKWRQLETLATAADVELPQLAQRIVDSDAHDALAERSGASRHSATESDLRIDRNWDDVFSGCDLTSTAGILVANQRFRSSDAPFSPENFSHKMAERVPVGKEAEFVSAFGEVAEFDLFNLRSFLEAFPTEWKSRLGIRAALAATLKKFCKRFCMTIQKNRYYELLPLKLACELSGIDESELLEVILVGISESTEVAGSDRLFSLVGLLCGKLSRDEAHDVLSYGLDLFNAVLEDTDGDGTWSPDLMPPSAPEDALAGYIWAGLASPVEAIRWEAAHVVVALCAFERKRILAGLMKHAAANTRMPFGDRRFVFYDLHAQQWLLIATARAAIENGSALAPHVGHFLAHAMRNQPHVIIRQFAARTALSLAAQGLICISDEAKRQMLAVNDSSFDAVQLESSHDDVASRSGAAIESLPENDRYFFGMDFGDDWLRPLGRCFGMLQPEIERETLKAVRGDLGYGGTHRWDDDARAKAGLFRNEGTGYRHGTYPRVDSYAFYLSYHSMLLTAGRLLAAVPLVVRSNDWEDDRFPSWLRRHDISRQDGRWLADRRDANPTGHPRWLADADRALWLGSIAADEFECALQASATEYRTVWGDWTVCDSSRVESISIHSALVSRERSASLLRALQTTEDPHSVWIPFAGDDSEIDSGSYQLKGWIASAPRGGGIDEQDRWAGNVRFPAPAPAAFVIETMNLSSDADGRIWQSAATSNGALRSEAWGDMPERDSSEGPSGRKLSASKDWIIEFLTEVRMDMIVEVAIARRSRYVRYENHDENEFARTPTSKRYFIGRSDGTINPL
jgi:hypothetical protein